MATNIANSRMTMAALLGTVTSTAAAITTTVSGIEGAVGMFNAAVQNARTNQSVRHELDQETYESTYTLQKAAEVEKIEHEIRSNLSQDAARQASFNEIHDRMVKRLAARKK